jgi:urease accessory protein
MLVRIAEPLGNLATYPLAGRVLERVVVRSDDLARRVLRIATSVGDIGVRFDGATRLRDGDVLHADAERVIAAVVAADDVLVMRPATIASAIDLAHAIGNRHIPIRRDGAALVVRFDPLLEALAQEHGVAVARESRVVADAFLHAHAPHAHD